MENFNWNLLLEGITTLVKALPENRRLRQWVVVGTVVIVAAAVFAASQSSKPRQDELGPSA